MSELKDAGSFESAAPELACLELPGSVPCADGGGCETLTVTPIYGAVKFRTDAETDRDPAQQTMRGI